MSRVEFEFERIAFSNINGPLFYAWLGMGPGLRQLLPPPWPRIVTSFDYDGNALLMGTDPPEAVQKVKELLTAVDRQPGGGDACRVHSAVSGRG